MAGTIRRGKVTRADLALWDGKNPTYSRIDTTGGSTTGLRVGNEVDVLQVFGGGTSRSFGAIESAKNYIASSVATLVLAPGTWEITSNLTLPENLSLRIPSGGVIAPSAGVTLTINGTTFVESPSHLSGDGDVVFRGGRIGPHITEAESAAGVTPSNYSYGQGDIRRYGAAIDGVTDDSGAWDAAVAQAAQPDGASVFHPGGDSAIHSSITLLPGVSIRGFSRDACFVTATADSFHVFTDANSPVSDVSIEDLTIRAVGAGAFNLGIFLDADTADISERITVRRVRFSNLYRGLHFHRAADVLIDDIDTTDLDDASAYVGLSEAAGRSRNVYVRRVAVTGGDLVHPLGSGNVLLAYIDGGSFDGGDFRGAGASAGAENLYHAVYLRSVTDFHVDDLRVDGQRRGAALTIWSDSGETRCRNVQLGKITATNQMHYAALRCDRVDNLHVESLVCDNGYRNGAYLTRCTNVTGTFKLFNNNRQRQSGMSNTAMLLENIDGADIQVNATDDDTDGGTVYGQGTAVTLGGTNTDLWISGRHVFPATGTGYYGVEILTGGTWTRGGMRSWVQNGASTAFHETGTGAGLEFRDVTMLNTGSSDLLSLDQLHKYRCGGVVIGGSAWRYESNGQNITAHLSNAPASGNWLRDDTVWRTAAAANATPGWRCTADHVASNGGTWKAMANLDA